MSSDKRTEPQDDDAYTLKIGPGPFPLSIHDPVIPDMPRSRPWTEQDAVTSRPRQIVRGTVVLSRVALTALAYLIRSVVAIMRILALIALTVAEMATADLDDDE